MQNYTIAFDIGGMHFRSGLVDDQGRVLSPVAVESPTRPEEAIEHIERIVNSFSVDAPNAPVGISIGGMVEKNGNVTSGSMNMVDYPLEERLNLRRPVVILNDAKAAALAEVTYNPRLSCKSSFVLLSLSWGIGGGIIINGEPYEGHTGTAGEVGHIVINRSIENYCRLGHRGCLDSLASGRAVNNRLHRLWREGHWTQHEKGVDISTLSHLLEENDGMAHTVLKETASWIGLGIMQIIRVADPCEIVFKGFLASELWDHLKPNIARVLASYEREIPMSLSSLGGNVGLVGAALAVKKNLVKI